MSLKAISDLVIEDFAAELIIKDERIASLESDNTSYRELALISIEHLACVTTRSERLARRLSATQIEYAAFRATDSRAHTVAS